MVCIDICRLPSLLTSLICNDNANPFSPKRIISFSLWEAWQKVTEFEVKILTYCTCNFFAEASSESTSRQYIWIGTYSKAMALKVSKSQKQFLGYQNPPQNKQSSLFWKKMLRQMSFVHFLEKFRTPNFFLDLLTFSFSAD